MSPCRLRDPGKGRIACTGARHRDVAAGERERAGRDLAGRRSMQHGLLLLRPRPVVVAGGSVTTRAQEITMVVSSANERETEHREGISSPRRPYHPLASHFSGSTGRPPRVAQRHAGRGEVPTPHRRPQPFAYGTVEPSIDREACGVARSRRARRSITGVPVLYRGRSRAREPPVCREIESLATVLQPLATATVLDQWRAGTCQQAGLVASGGIRGNGGGGSPRCSRLCAARWDSWSPPCSRFLSSVRVPAIGSNPIDQKKAEAEQVYAQIITLDQNLSARPTRRSTWRTCVSRRSGSSRPTATSLHGRAEFGGAGR